jgi:hypothetical protein
LLANPHRGTYFRHMGISKADEAPDDTSNSDRRLAAWISQVHPAAFLLVSLAIASVLTLAGAELPPWADSQASVLRLVLIGAVLFLAGVYFGLRIVHYRLRRLYPIHVNGN